MISCAVHPTELAVSRCQPDAELLRRDLAQQADVIAAVIAEATNRPTEERMRRSLMLLDGVRSLMQCYRAALRLEAEQEGHHHDI